MRIIKATYGGADCTKELSKRVVDNKLALMVSNSIIGDPLIGIRKELVVEWTDGEQTFKDAALEGMFITIPKVVSKRLGVFYSNNNNPKINVAINKSLETIQLAAKGKADIITCTWEPIHDNPFLELRSWYKETSHLNQLLQVMQCLVTAKSMGQYDYVSFLEHDVMYPEGYFDYQEFAPGNILTNMNYGGLNTTGWQKRGQNDEPFHQMTMRFEDALVHCNQLLDNALLTNSGCIEPQSLERLQWRCTNEAIHINHGYHFTSHNSIYRKEGTYLEHPYWGKHSDYLYLFNK